MASLRGASAWLVTDGKAGHEAQAEGVARALGLDFEWRRVAPAGLARLMAPWGPAARDFDCSAPWPAIAIGIGRTAMPALRLVRKRAGMATFVVALQDPRTGPRIADLIWVPEHDTRRGPNVVTTLLPPNRFDEGLLAGLRDKPDPEVDALPGPRVMLAIGGAAKAWRFTDDDAARLAAAITGLGRSGASLLVTPSRRTPEPVVRRARAALEPFPHIFYDGTGENPYAIFLAKADAIVVTADSVSMTGEALSAGRPVYVFRPTGGSAKFDRFHTALMAAGMTRPVLPDTRFDMQTAQEPVRAADEIARIIEARWANRAQYLSRLMGGQR